MCLFSAPANAYELNGRITGDLYSWQGPEQDHIRPYIRFWGDMLVWRSPEGRSVRLHTSLRWTTDFADKLTSDPSLFVYDAYAHFRGVPSNTDWYLGRQFVYSGVGSALLDGGRVRYRYRNKLDFDIFGGSSVSSADPEEIRSIGDFLVVGGRLGTRAIRKTPLGVSWMLKRRDGGNSFHRVGVDATRLLKSSELFARAAYNIEDLRLAEVLARAIYHPGLWYFSGEYFWREPLVASNSIFTLIDFSHYQTGRIEARRRVWRQFSVLTTVQATVSDGEDTWRARLGFVTPTYSLSWIHQTGYGGDNDGLSGYLNQPLSERLDCFVTANLFRYRVQLEQTDRSDAYATTFGLRWRAGGGFAIRAEGQYLRNAVMQDDWRYLLRISKNFSVTSDKGREEGR